VTHPITVRACAKVNLHLAVHGRRDDGYHDLTTIFQSIALHDTLTIVPREGPFAIECDDAAIPVDETNLIWRAASALATRVGLAPSRVGLAAPRDVLIRLEKVIPTQAGLGGGSADAMATLRGLHRLWKIARDAVDIRVLARDLGADVAFFAVGGTALGRGRGDDISSLPDLPPMSLLIVLPPFAVATSDAYRWIANAAREPENGSDASDPWPSQTSDWKLVLAHLVNAFEPVVAQRHPEIVVTLQRLRDAGADFARMSGSGSAVFGLFDTPTKAAAAAATFTAPGYRVWVTRTLPAAGYRQATSPEPRVPSP
jgi:4-diphosphocytidyl-2-C-methyl-D-erythritol kinase